MNKLLFAVFSAGAVSVTYLDAAGETVAAKLAMPEDAAAMRDALASTTGAAVDGFQLYSADADPTNGGANIEALMADGSARKVVPNLDEEPAGIALAALRDSLREQIVTAIGG